jgi:Flp pilus assembly protein TadG
MMASQRSWLAVRRNRSIRRRTSPRLGAGRPEQGYVAALVALLLATLVGLSAFAVDVGHWYFVGQQAQRAADAAALAGVTDLPGSQSGAFALARSYSKANGFEGGVNSTTVTPSIDGAPTRLRVTVTRSVGNIFGPLLGVPTTTVTRTAVADYAGPVPMGSPCNEFGDDPTGDGLRSADCLQAGAFWANVGSLPATKSYGDAFQDNSCSSGTDGCSGGTNVDYDPDGYIYTITLRQPVANLRIEAFDPAQVVVGDNCDQNLSGAAALGNKAPVADPAQRYASGNGPFCTGDVAYLGTKGLIRTQFTVHSPGANAWEPLAWPTVCQKTFEPFNGNLSKALDKTNAAYNTDGVADNFRRWVPVCTFAGTAPAGTYAIQVKTNGLGADNQAGHNRFALRAFGSDSSSKDVISIAGFNKMAIYGNTPAGTSKFFLGRVPKGAAGQVFNIHLFDIGDGAKPGSTITVVPPPDSGLSSFSGCVGSGVVTGSLSGCKISVSSAYNGKWQTISVPIPVGYTCDASSATGCWVRLQFFYGSGSTPQDTTSWTASIDGDPIRLVE